MNKDEFIDRYCEDSNITRERFDESRITLPCACGRENCEGWRTIPQLWSRNYNKLPSY